MGLFDLLRGTDINKKLQEMREVKGAVLLDVRNADEYRSGHIPGAINVPVDSGRGDVVHGIYPRGLYGYNKGLEHISCYSRIFQSV